MSDALSAVRLFLYSSVGIVVFFIPISIGGTTTIPLDHIVTALRVYSPSFSGAYALIIVFCGALYPFVRKTWNKDKVSVAFSILKVLGLAITTLYILKLGPAWLFEPDMGPFLFEKLVVPVGIIVPIGSVFLAFLVGYGLLEFVGVLMQPIMKPIWNTSGRSAIDAVASFVGSYSIGLLITNRVFKEGKYTIKEAAIIATGFSTVSATFMIIVAKTTGLMDMWNMYFWSTMLTTFVVTAITVRIYPLSSKKQAYIIENVGSPPQINGGYFKSALAEGIRTALSAPKLGKSISDNVRDGFVMVMAILPSIMSVGLFGLVLAKYTPLFDILGYTFWPITTFLKLPEAGLAAKATAVGIAEMFLPALLVAGAPLATKYVVSVVSVSSILFFSASIPCILSTEIPITLWEILLIWVERAALSLLIATLLSMLLF